MVSFTFLNHVYCSAIFCETCVQESYGQYCVHGLKLQHFIFAFMLQKSEKKK